MMEQSNDPSSELLAELIDLVTEISTISECRIAYKKMHCDLVRRIKLLNPMFEELKDGNKILNEDEFRGFNSLRISMILALQLLKSINDGSKVYQALRWEKIAESFNQITEKIRVALDGIPHDKLDLSEEIQEQIELVHSQLRRAQEIPDSCNLQLPHDLSIAWKEKNPDPAVLKRLSETLQLKTIDDLKKESSAFHELVISKGDDPGEWFEKVSSLLKKLNDYVLTHKEEGDASERKNGFVKHPSPVIPDDFRCPISLELMKDPVIVSTGQTYERFCIQRWLDSGHKTCPKTQQTLSHATLTPNYALKSLISLWCESNGVQLLDQQGTCKSKKLNGNILESDKAAIVALVEKLAEGDVEQQRAAAGEMRLLAKRKSDNRACIAEVGAIPLLVNLLSSSDQRTQEHAVTALLNLSINDGNKETIVNAGAIPKIVSVLKTGSMEARENAAATLFSLSVIDENKVAIGTAGAIPALVTLLCDGSPRGKKDAATAIFNLSIHQGNKVRAVRAGILSPLMHLLKDPGSGMLDEALAILAILASHQEGKIAIGQAEPVSLMIEIVRTGSPRNRENASSVLWSLCSSDSAQLKAAMELGLDEALRELLENGTDRAKRKAMNILELFQQHDDEKMK